MFLSRGQFERQHTAVGLGWFWGQLTCLRETGILFYPILPALGIAVRCASTGQNIVGNEFAPQRLKIITLQASRTLWAKVKGVWKFD
jgi:hypothetical protein